MKWKSKGHEFDQVYNRLKSKNKFWLFGAGMYGEAIYEELEKIGVGILGFIDNNELKWHTTYMKKEILPLEEISLKDDEAIVVCVSPYSRGPIMKQLMKEQ